MKLNKEFLLAGKSIFTVELSKEAASLCGKPHFTYMIKRRTNGQLIVLLLLRGPDFAHLNEMLGYLDAATMTLRRTWGAGGRAVATATVEKALEVITGGPAAFEKFHAGGHNVHISDRCCRCGKVLTDPASIETGIGPECELYVKLGVGSLDEVPCMTDRQVARLQYSYWMNSDKLTLAALKDACLEAGMSGEKADQMVEATKRTMRKFKKIRGHTKLKNAFIRFAEGY